MIRIRRLLIRELVALVGLTVALLMGLAWWGAVRAMDTQANERASAGLSHLESELNTRLKMAQQLGDSLGSLWLTGALGPEPSEASQKLAQAILNGYEGIPNIVMAGQDDQSFTGRFQDGHWDTRILVQSEGTERVQSARWDRYGRLVERSLTSMAPIHWRTRPWYRSAEQATAPFWTEPYLFVNPSVPGISYIVPIRKIDGTFLGAICVDLLLEDLSRLVKDIQPTPNTLVVISDSRGRTLTAPDQPGTEPREQLFMKPLSPTFLPVIHALQATASPSPGQDTSWPRLRIGGITYLTQVRALKGPPGIAWNISVAIPTMDLLQEARWRALASLYLGLAALGFVAWRVRHLARRFSEPLVRLAESSDALARGEAVTPAPSDILEIEQVGQAFHTASRTLKERNDLEARVQHIQRLETLGTLAGGIAHDINNQLQAISGKVALGLLTAPSEGAFRRHLEQAEEATLRCAEITLSLLSFSRPNRPQPLPLDLNQVVRQAAGLLEHIRGRQVVVTLELAPSLPPVLGQGVQLEQVFLNLGVNAKDAMPEGGTLTFATSPTSSGGICVRVSDTGTGMSPEVLARMSDPFFTTKAEGKGTGLGMAMVTGILSAHGASLSVASELGRGTTFTLSFPGAPQG